MAPETTAQAHGPEGVVDHITEQAAERARTVEEYRREYRRGAQALIEGGGEAGALAARRLDLVDRTAQGVGHVRIEEQEANVGGMNKIGGGDESMTLNKKSFASLDSAEDAERIRHTYEHERAHGRAKHLRGSLVSGAQGKGGNVQDLLQEGYAEIVANEQTGKSRESRRDGQPREVYGEGQELVLHLIGRTSRERVEELMTGDGDLDRFQRDLQQETAYVTAA